MSRIDLEQLERTLNDPTITPPKPTPPVTLRRPVVAEPTKPIHTLQLTREREKTHGDYAESAYIAQGLKRVIWSGEGWRRLNEVQRESVEMFCTKLGRILAGNPNVKDHWDDIAGYAKLCSDRITEG